jgi:hypothetical protein
MALLITALIVWANLLALDGSVPAIGPGGNGGRTSKYQLT